MRSKILSVLAILIIAGSVAVARGSGDSAYEAHVAALCRATDQAMAPKSVGMFEWVQESSHRHAIGLAGLTPPSSRAGLHREMLAAERAINAQAVTAGQVHRQQGSQATVPHFRALRRLQSAQERRYRSLGVSGCSDQPLTR